MSNLILFFLFYGLSMIPWTIAFFVREKSETLRGLLYIDVALTIASYIYLAKAIGWWAVLFFFVMVGVSKIFEDIGLYPYKSVFAKKAK